MTKDVTDAANHENTGNLNEDLKKGILGQGVDENEVWETWQRDMTDVLILEDELQIQHIIKNLPFSLDIAEFDGTILYANTKFLELFELEKTDDGNKDIRKLWVDVEKRNYWIESLKQEGIVNDFEMHLKTAHGREFWAIGSGMIIQYQKRKCILSTQIDITERKRMESALKSSEEKYRLLTEFASDVIWVLDLEKLEYTYVSPSIYYLTGYTAAEALGMNLMDSITGESQLIIKEAFERGLREFLMNPDDPKSHILEVRQRCKNGDVIWVEVSFKYRYNAAESIEIVGVSRNIEGRKKSEREVLYLSYHDQLTGLYNRRFYDEELQRINFQRNLPITLVVGDVNGLKLTNDVFGHVAGDSLLKNIAAILNKELRAEDVAARIGGDEFALLLPRTDSSGAEALVGRIKQDFLNTEPENSILSVSFGWAVKEALEDDFGKLFKHAEDIMYHKKLTESPDMKCRTILLTMRKLYQKYVSEQQHSENVGCLCRKIGKVLNLPEGELKELELLGKMHDIGKIGIREDILNKTRKLAKSDWREIRRHPEVGYQILRSADEYVHIAESVLSHHERVDGTGYPRNLTLDEIPLQSRILAVAEAFDAMRTGGGYREPVSELEAVRELTANSGTQFDSNITKVFIEQVLKYN